MLAATTMPAAIAEIGGGAYIGWAFMLYQLGSIVAGAATALLVTRLGIRRAMMIAALIYGIGGTLCATAPAMAVFLAGRAVQGYGGGWSIVLVYVAVSRFFPDNMVPRLMALISVVWSLSAFLGPLVGGTFSSLGMWRMAYWVFVFQPLILKDIVRLILDGTGVKARLDGRVLSIPLLVLLGVRRDGQKVLLAVKNMGGETEAAWRHVLEDLLGRGLKAPELLIVDGGKGLEAALASLWSDIPVQRCTVHKERNLLAHAPKALHDEVKADYTDMMYAENAEQVRKKRKAFLAKWRLRCRGVADSMEEAGERLFTFLRYPPQQWKSLRTTNAIERLHGEFKRRVKTQCALPNAETAAMLFWALMASGQITMRRVGGWQTLDQAPVKKPIDLAA